jgi:tetratricopeptide (TPR) repeat protein
VETAAAAEQAARDSRVSAGVAEALREMHGRVEEAWKLSDFPDRMQQTTDAAAAALRRGDDFANGGAPAEVARDLALAHQEFDELSRHTRLIQALSALSHKFAEEATGHGWSEPMQHLAPRTTEALTEFGLDPLHDPVEEVANTIVSSRFRDVLLEALRSWHWHRGPNRLGQIVRLVRQKSGGAYARWQELLDAGDVPGLVAFAASPDVLSFGRRARGSLFLDLRDAKQFAACRTLQRATAERYPDNEWVHCDLAGICLEMDPPEYAEALRHSSAAALLRPQSAFFQLQLGDCYDGLGAYEQAKACYRKGIELGHGAIGGYLHLCDILEKKKDWDGAIAAVREAIRLQPNDGAAFNKLSMILFAAGRQAEGFKEMVAVMREHPDLFRDLRYYLRYNAACLAVACAEGQGANPPPPAERPAYRKHALDFLTDELAAVRQEAAKNPSHAHRYLKNWLKDDDLKPVRESEALGRLPAAERDAWNKFWKAVRALRDQTAPQKAGPRQPG